MPHQSHGVVANERSLVFLLPVALNTSTNNDSSFARHKRKKSARVVYHDRLEIHLAHARPLELLRETRDF